MSTPRWLSVVCFLALAACQGPSAPQPDGPALTINGEPVSRADFVQALLMDQGEAYARRFAVQRDLEARAKAANITLDDALVKTRQSKEERRLIVQRFGGSEAKFLEHIAEYGVSRETWRRTRRRRLRTELLAERLMQAAVPEARVRELFERRYGAGGVSRDVHHILVSTQVAASTLYTRADYQAEKAQVVEAARARAEAVRRKLIAGADFAATAKAESDGFSAERGGALGAAWQGRYGSAFDAAVAKLRVGAISAVVEGKRGFHVIQATGKRRGAVYEGRAIELRVPPQADEAAWAAAKGKAESVRARLLAGKESFEQVARLTSEDPRGRAAGGATGPFGPGKFGEAADAVLERLPLNQVSPPLRTAQGYVLLRLEKRAFQPARDRLTVRHILIGTAYDLVKQRKLGPSLEAQAQARADTLLARVKAPQADFEAIAREASEDPLTKRKGGRMAPFVAGALGPEVDAALAKLAPGEVTLVRSKRGFHIVRVDRARKADFQKVRAELEQELRKQPPKPEAVQAWIRAQGEALKVELKF